MQDNQDYYSILGVQRDASDIEIRRAFRNLAKLLHPDIQSTAAGTDTGHDFSQVTEAYETLRDESRRRAYDEELNSARRLAPSAPPGKWPRRAFAAGLGAGLVIALALLAVNRWGIAPVAKTQDSLRLQTAAKVPVPKATKSSDDAVTEASIAVRAEPATTEPESRAAPLTNARALSAEPAPSTANPPTPEVMRISSTGTANEPAAEGEIRAQPGIVVFPLKQRSESAGASLSSGSSIGKSINPEPTVRQASAVGSDQARLSKQPPAADIAPKPAKTDESAFATEIARLERAIEAPNGGAAAYQLISAVRTATKIEDLDHAAALAQRPETRELIDSRIAEIKSARGQNADEPETALVGEPPHSQRLADSAVRPRAPLDSGAIEVVTGPRGRESLLTLTPGNGVAESFVDCSGCPEMVVIPGGQGVMGSRPENESHRADESPAHRVVIRRPFAVTKSVISLQNWRACSDAGVCPPTMPPFVAFRSDAPATRVSWFDAKAYVAWLSQTTGFHYRLLSEAEWEYVARGGKSSSAGGSAGDSHRAAIEAIRELTLSPFRPRVQQGRGLTPSTWGLYSNTGGTMEWVEDCWHVSYEHAPADSSAWLSASGGDCAYRVVRGSGGAAAEFGGQRPTARAREFADARDPKIGFRVARDIASSTKTALDMR